MQRVLVLGSSGSGKSTFARRLGAVTGLPVVHIDQLYWGPGWVQVPDDVYLQRLRNALAQPRWIIDGNNSLTLDLRVPRADRIVLLDRSRLLCVARVMARVAKSRGKVRADMAPECPERFDWEFMKYVWNFPNVHWKRTLAAVERHDAWERTTTLRNDAESAAFIEALQRSRTAGLNAT